MYYADVDLGGGTYAFKKRFLKIVENAHAYYMPDFAGMVDHTYREIDADHHVYIRVSDVKTLNRVIDVLKRRYRFYPDIHERMASEEVFDRGGKTYAQLTYEKRDYKGREIYPGVEQDEEEDA